MTTSPGSNLVLTLGVSIVITGIYTITRPLHEPLPENIKIASLGVLSFIAICFSILLGFFVSYFLTRFLDIERTLVNEVTQLELIARILREIPESLEVQNALRAYVESVIRDEWPRLIKGQSSAQTEVLQSRFSELLIRLANQYPELVSLQTALNNLTTGEWRKRLVAVLRANRLFITVTAIAGILALVGFWLIEHRASIFMFLIDLGAVILVALGLFLLTTLNRPFSQNELGLTPEIYQDVLRELR